MDYANNTKPGTATVTITGVGNYAGTRLLFFDIVPPQAEEEEKPSGGSTSGGNTGNGGETTETTGEAQQDRLVVDETGAAMPYTYSTVEKLEEATGAVLARTVGRHRLSRVYAHPLCGEGRGARVAAGFYAGG